MELRHEFTVPVPVDDAWRALLDIERVAPCLPGATVEEFDDKTVTGSVRVKVGPVTVTYKGTRSSRSGTNRPAGWCWSRAAGTLGGRARPAPRSPAR